MKPYHKNPRQIGKGRFDKLTATLSRLGDLGGIVHNLETDEIVGGNQRSRVFGEASKVEIVEQYEQPDEQGTVAHGFIVWNGKKFAYRQVRWDEKTAEEANITANMAAGTWDWEVIANAWQPADLMEYGFDADLLRDWKRDITAVGMMMGAEGVDYNAEWQGMPEFNQEDLSPMKSIIVHFKSQEDVDAFAELFGQKITEKTKYLWYPERQRADLLALVAHDES